jgi:tetratricopeptide (TPR) repeat protein
MQYKEHRPPLPQIAKELDVGYVLEGTVRWDRGGKGHGRVRITPQLIKVTDDSHLWSDRYDRVLEDIFMVQTDIAEQVTAQLEMTILEPERRAVAARLTDNMEAYQAYLAGIRYRRGSREERNMRLTIEMFERAVQLDPGFEIAHAALSMAHSRLYHWRYDYTTERLEKAKVFAERALDLQPGLPEGHRALGWYYYWGYRDYDRALEHFALSAERLPNDPDLLMGTFAVLRRQGRWDDALEALERSRRADPQSYEVALSSLDTYSVLHEFEKAEEGMRRAVAIAPDLPDAYYIGALNFVLWDGATDRARLLLESAPNLDSPEIGYQELLLDLYDRKPESVLARLEDVSIDAFSLTYWYVPRGLLECTALSQMSEWKRAEAACASAVELLEREIETKPHHFLLHIALGHTYALLGRKEEAMGAGEQAVELMPISKDALDGPDQAIELAKIYSRVGEADKALDLIDELLSIPSWLSVGLLRLDPVWDPLRDHPRFQALLEKYDTN